MPWVQVYPRYEKADPWANPYLPCRYRKLLGTGMGTGIAKIPMGYLCQSLQIIIHAVNQSWAVYDPNAEPTSGHGRRCGVCKAAGREGSDCPGKSNCAKCKYNCKYYILTPLFLVPLRNQVSRSELWSLCLTPVNFQVCKADLFQLWCHVTSLTVALTTK